MTHQASGQAKTKGEPLSYWHEPLQKPIDFSLKADDFYGKLKKEGYCAVPFFVTPSLIQEAVQAFFRFLDEPDSVKNHIDFSVAPLHRRGEVGYRCRRSENHLYDDDKAFFHFHPALFDKYRSFLSQNPVVKDFAVKAQPLWEKAYQTVWTLLGFFQDQYPQIRDQVFGTEEVHLLLRFLKYDWHESGEYLAKPHYDAGSFTLAISESCPGLRIGTGPEKLKPVIHEENRALFMLSSNFQKLMPGENLEPGWHDVIQIDKTVIGKPFSRWAVVAFFDAHSVTALERSETHKWVTTDR